MSCENCHDKGLTVLNWTDAEPDYAVCICAAGLALRVNRNVGHTVLPLWHVWCAREQISPTRVYMLEDVLTAEELALVGLRVPAAEPAPEAALLALGRTKKARL